MPLIMVANGAPYRRSLANGRRYINVFDVGRRRACLNAFLISWRRNSSWKLIFQFCHWIQPPLRKVQTLLGAKKNGKQAIGRSRGGLTSKLHAIVANSKAIVAFSITSGEAADGPQGRLLMKSLTPELIEGSNILMDRAYEGDDTRKTAVDLGMTPCVPPKSNRREPWDYDVELYKQRNEVERFFRRIKRFRRIQTRYEKLDLMFRSVFLVVMIMEFITY